MNNSNDTSTSLLLRHARIVLPRRVAEHAALLIENNRIVRLIEEAEEVGSQVATADVEIDLSGLTLFPGFIDVHIHGAVGVDVMEASVDDLHKVAKFLASEGVTAWLPTTVPAPDQDYRRVAATVEQLIEEQDAARKHQLIAARALGIHYEGPYVNVKQCGALRTAYFRDFSDPATLDALVSLRHEAAVHMTTLAPEIENGIELVRQLHARGWIISIGHTRAEVEVLERAHQAGARHMTHLPNAMLALHHREPGPIGWGLMRDDVTCDVIADSVHMNQLMLQLILRCKTPERVVLISDAVLPAGMGDGEYQVWGETITVRDGRTSNERGSIAGSVITMRDAAQMMLSLGVAPSDVARMSASNPARLLQLENEIGSIEIGKRADLVALDANGKVRLTIIGGRIAFDELEATGEQ